MKHRLRREIGLFSATLLVIANMVGTGVFTTSGFIMAEVGNPSVLLICWVMGGVFSLCGALCYAELGTLFPRAGGEYVFLQQSFGKLVGFVSGWISLVVGFSAPIAAAAMAFATYSVSALPVLDSGLSTWPAFGIDAPVVSPVTILALVVIAVFSLIHCHSVSLGSRVQNVLTLFKTGIIVVFITAGLTVAKASPHSLFSPFSLTDLFRKEFAVSLIFVSFAYSGWNAAAYIGGEIRNPSRNIPVAMLTGTVVVAVIYLLLNVVYVSALGPAAMRGVLEIGGKSATALFGASAGSWFAGAIALGLLSVVSAMIMAGPRVYYAMARDGLFFGRVGAVIPDRRTPAHAILLQAGISMLMVLTASFETLLMYIGFTLSLCATLTVAGLMRLRRRQAPRPGAYLTPWYPATPVFFILGNLWIIVFSIISRPAAAGAGALTIGTGMLVYGWFKKRPSRESGHGRVDGGGHAHEKSASPTKCATSER